MKKIMLIWLPFFIGLFLITVSAIDVQLFKSNNMSVGTMLAIEIPIVFFGLVSSVIVFVSTFYWLFKKRWLIAIQSLVSPVLFIICFGIGGAMGAAYLNAT